ncbi:MFS transporter [Renibacterium salmoninarum]|uniref:MFS transporter n=1 Tax=Renibacterium salmoninarum TaxID=1646 RepID=UPI0003218E6A|nr:MFS transporter [Renibacterium salmoninarum]
MTGSTPAQPMTVQAIQRRTVGVLAAGSLLAVDLSGSDAWAGSVTTLLTLAAAFSAMPMASFARKRGRRVSLSLCLTVAFAGAVLMVVAAATRSFPSVLVAAAGLGFSTTENLQSRFAAADLAASEHRGRDLAIVVWATTLGAVAGPNLVRPGAQLGNFLGLPENSGPFLFSATSMLLGMILLSIGLRPDPLLTAQKIANQEQSVQKLSRRAGFASIRESPSAMVAFISVVGSHVVMVSVMAMTPLHLKQVDERAAMGHHGTDVLAIIGFTISLHIAGMFALSPLFGWLSDRLGRVKVIIGGQIILLSAVAVAGFGQSNTNAVTVGLILLGLGWSASTIAGSTLLSESVPASEKVQVQGVSDTLMGFSAAAGSVLAGIALAYWGFAGLTAIATAIVLAVAMAVFSSVQKRRASSRAG